jgi:hypothetical protein
MSYLHNTPDVKSERVNLNKLSKYFMSLSFKGLDADLLVSYLRDQGLSDRDLGVVLKKSFQAVNHMYPHKKTTAETVALSKGEV